MAKELVVSASPQETKIALLEDGQVVEVSIEREKETGLVGSIYKGRVTRVLPGMQSAFVEIGLERDAFLYVSDFFEDREEYERIVTGPEEAVRPAAAGKAAESPAAALEPPAKAAVEAKLVEPAVEDKPAADSAPAPQTSAPPEGRRLGRRSHRGGGRGGRGRSHRRFEQRPQRPELPSAPEPYEPIILPGESLAKYRDRAPQSALVVEESPAAEPVRGGQVTAEPVDLGFSEPASPVAGAEPRRSVAEATREAETRVAEPGPSKLAPASPAREEPPAEQPRSAEAVVEPEPGRERAAWEVARRKAKSDYIPVAEVGVSESAAVPVAEPETLETDVPVERHPVRAEEDNGAVALPPSVRERTAGGVLWERPHGRRPRGRRGRMPERERRRRRPIARAPQAKITDLLRPGQETIVQIAKEQIGTKGARITSHVTLPGRFIVYMPTIDHVGVSRRIRSEQVRGRLRRLLLELKATLTGGIVVRTAAEQASDDDIRRDLESLVKLWRDILQKAEQLSAPALLHRDRGLVERFLRDQLTEDFDAIWVDNEEVYTKTLEYVNTFQPSLAPRVKLYTKDVPIFEAMMGIQQEMDQALKPQVRLKSGGYIVINHTEALVAIDVNTGKFVGKGSTRLEDTIVRTNLEAVKEVVRQIRLRDLGGIIIIDFIDMEELRNRHKVMQELERALRADRAPYKMLAFNEFGLIAITRKRVRQSLEKVLCQPCPYCTGTGMVKSVETLCYEIQAEARKMAKTIDAPELTIRAHPEIAKALKSKESGLLRALEEQTGKNIIVQPDQALYFDQYNIF